MVGAVSDSAHLLRLGSAPRLRFGMWGRASVVALALVTAGAVQPPPAAAVTKAQATAIVTRIVRRNADECRLAITRTVAARIPTGWRVTVYFRIRGGRGYAAWHVAGSRPVPADPAAKLIVKGCP